MWLVSVQTKGHLDKEAFEDWGCLDFFFLPEVKVCLVVPEHGTSHSNPSLKALGGERH